MRICFATNEGVIFSRGGPYTKIKEVREKLLHKGIDVDLFDQWNTNLNEYDLVHLVSSNFAVYNLARIMHINKIKFIVEPVFFSTHSSSFLNFFNRLDSITRKVSRGIWFDYGFTRDICDWALKVTPNTVDEKKLISNGLSIPEEKFKIIHNGVSDKFLNADPSLFEKEYGIKDFILSVGHIGPARKNMLSFVKALSNINHPAVFIGKIIQSGESENVLKEAVKNKNLRIIDAFDNDSPMLASAYAAANTFVLPSLYETPGIAALEAGLAGAKIVITPFGGTKDYFKEMAEYVNPYFIDSIRKGIEKTLNKPKDNMLKEYIRQNFLWDKIADETVNLYSEVLSRQK
jgi:glycosyltransferase involved in cell wall biosynthesis